MVWFRKLRKHRDCAFLAEWGRKLASEREDLIVSGVDPALLEVPILYDCPCLDKPKTIEDLKDGTP